MGMFKSGPESGWRGGCETVELKQFIVFKIMYLLYPFLIPYYKSQLVLKEFTLNHETSHPQIKVIVQYT